MHSTQLKREWALSFFRRQPMDKIREYLGEKIALYFAYLGFYTVWLMWAALAGVLVAIYGIANAVKCVRHVGWVRARCRHAGPGAEAYPSVPSACRICLRARWGGGGGDAPPVSGEFTITGTGATRIFDNALTLPFAAFMSIWGRIALSHARARSGWHCRRARSSAQT